MILSDRTIDKYLTSGKIYVEPNTDVDQLQPCSLDVRMGEHLYDFYRDEEYDYSDGVVLLEPWTFYIGHTLDHIYLPKDIAAQLTGRSSVGRRGVVIHKTAGWIDAGFEGQITLEIFNFSLDPVEIDVGERVGQLVFFPTDRPTMGYDGQFQGQEGITK